VHYLIKTTLPGLETYYSKYNKCLSFCFSKTKEIYQERSLWTLHIKIQRGHTCLFVFLQADGLFI